MIFAESGIAADHREILGDRLRDQQAIERVTVIGVGWQTGQFVQMPKFDGKERRRN